MKKNILNSQYMIEEAIKLLKKKALFSLDETIEFIIHSDLKNLTIRDFCFLPCFLGNIPKIGVYAPELDEFFFQQHSIKHYNEQLKSQLVLGKLSFDFLITTPVSFYLLKPFMKLLKSKGLLPSIEHKTITTNINETIANMRNNITKYCINKKGEIFISIGYLSSFTLNIEKNLLFFLSYLKTKIDIIYKKKIFIKNLYISTTFGQPLRIGLS